MCSAWNSPVQTQGLQGLKISLRPPAMQDAPRLAALAADAGRAPQQQAMADAEAYLARATAGEAGGDCALMVEHPTAGVIGCVGFKAGADGLWPELGYWIAREHAGNGYATEAASLALGWARRRGLRAVVSGHCADNPAAGRVLDKLGFLYTGEVRQQARPVDGGLKAKRMMAWLA
jgi:RimJ/RimL family protein N-acetyltransferase